MQTAIRMACFSALIFASATASAAQPNPIKVGTDAVRNATADPAAVQFRNLRLKGSVVCGEYNAKNGFGAYTGFKLFAFDRVTGEGFMLGVMARISRKGVVESADDIIKAVRTGADTGTLRARMDKLTADAQSMLLKCA